MKQTNKSSKLDPSNTNNSKTFTKKGSSNFDKPKGNSKVDPSNTNNSSSKKPQNSNSPNKSAKDNSALFKNTTHFKLQVMESIIESISEKSEINLKKEYIEINRTNNLLDKIITEVGNNPKMLKKGVENVIGLDSKNDIKLFNSMKNIEKNLLSTQLSSALEDATDQELVEVNFFKQLKKENEEFSIQHSALQEENKQLKVTLRKSAGEALFTKDMSENQDKEKSDKIKKIKKLDEDIIENEKLLKDLKESLTGEKLEKDSLYRALMSFTKTYDVNLAMELDEIYKQLNNQYFFATYRPPDEKLVEDLFGKISHMERKIKKKDFELGQLNKVLPDKKNGSNKKNTKIRSSLTSSLPSIQSGKKSK